ncbi:excisionase family DNA-binding protein [Roseobacter sp. TSBP12]|uniref:excisionase family DNA-binding protein n=1 Tax=Roseobacter sp. TSBP12 TaxID=1236613 RepID=UPI00125F7849
MPALRRADRHEDRQSSNPKYEQGDEVRQMQRLGHHHQQARWDLSAEWRLAHIPGPGDVLALSWLGRVQIGSHMEHAKPFSPETLASRWDCSDQAIRDMIHRGELRAFRVGRMFRIPHQVVLEREKCQTSPSENSEAGFASIGERTESDDVISLRHAPERRPRQRP